MLELSGQPLLIEQIAAVATARLNVGLSAAAKERVAISRALVDRVIEEGRVVYGINTGFGKLSEVHIAPADVDALQLNLVRSHSCGLGRPLSEAETRAMMLLRANVLSLGYSGCRINVIEMLIEMLERGVHPLIPEKGSVGASGDLAPLAHLALSMIGEGECWYRGERINSAAALRSAEIAPLHLAAKEGLALLNGTQAMGAVGALALRRALRVAALAST
jgi:histidine ammonia-lyase